MGYSIQSPAPPLCGRTAYRDLSSLKHIGSISHLPESHTDHSPGTISEHDIVDILYHAGRTALAASIAAGVILNFVLWSPETRIYLGSWFLLLVAVCMWRFHILLSYDRAVARGLSIDPRAWIYSFDYSIAISGAVWGIGGLIIGLHTDLTGHILFTLCVCGLVAGSVATFFTHLRTLFAFATPTILPFSIQLILSNTREDIVIGGCLLTFAGIVSIIAVQVHDSLDRVLPKRKDAESLGKSRQQSLEQRRVEHLYRAALLTSSGSVLAASTAIFILRNEVDFTNAALWIVAICVAVSLRVLKVVQFRRGSVGGHSIRLLVA